MTNMNISKFLENTDWVGASVTPMGADMGLRRYARLEKGGCEALFMDMSRSGILETGLKEYVAVAEYLKAIGVNVPEIYDHDLETGLSVIEKCGGASFGDMKKRGHDPRDIYLKATQALVDIKTGSSDNVLALQGYEETLIRKRLRQFVDYYVPAVTDIEPTDELAQEFENILEDIASSLPPCPMGLCHADYHLENIMWCPDKKGGYALIDFQDAFWGFQGYDLLNLLEDARQTVPAEIKTEMRDLYCQSMSSEEREIFDQWYALMSMHFHCRVIGLFIKFARETGGTEFLEHIPRLQGYITKNLNNPIFNPLQEWFDHHHISFSRVVKV